MKALSNYSLSRKDGELSIKICRDNDPESEGVKSIGTFEYFSISGNDLTLTQDKYYALRLDANDSLTDWKLLNVNHSDCAVDKLDRLIKDCGFEEIKIVFIGNRKKLIIKSEKEYYQFRCDNIIREVRGFSRKEIVDKFNEKEIYLREVEMEHSKMCLFLTRLFRFVNRESIDYKNLLNAQMNHESGLATKSMHYLEVLTRIKDKLDDLRKIMPEHVFHH